MFRPSLVTQSPRSPWSSIAVLNFAWFCELYNSLLHGVGATFAARRLTDDPRMLVLVSTCGLLFSGTIGPLVNYASDRIWTPFGRRRPFVVGAFFLSAASLAIVPLMDSLPTLLLAVAAHACIHSFASPLESLCMELVPPPQQGRAQAIRNAYVQIGVLFFFQIVLVQFDARYETPAPLFRLAGGITGVHLAFWLGSAALALSGLHFLVCTRERRPHEAGSATTNPGWWPMLCAFPRAVFADRLLWPVYGLYIVPAVATGVWGSLEPLMLVDQFGFTMTEMARIGLPTTLIGLAVTGPLLGYFADGRASWGLAKLLVLAAFFAGTAAIAYRWLPADPFQLPPLAASLAFVLPVSLAAAMLFLAGARLVPANWVRGSHQGRFIVVSVVEKITLAACVWTWVHHVRGPAPGLPRALWLAIAAIGQVSTLGSLVSVIPMLFSLLPSSKFGTVSSGFGIANSAVTYLLGNLGAAWLHFRGGSLPAARVEYSELWLLQAPVGALALWIAIRCLNAESLRHASPAATRDAAGA